MSKNLQADLDNANELLDHYRIYEIKYKNIKAIIYNLVDLDMTPEECKLRLSELNNYDGESHH